MRDRGTPGGLTRAGLVAACGAALLAACSSPQQAAVDEERIARRVVALLRAEGLVGRGDGDAGPRRAEGDEADEAEDEEEAARDGDDADDRAVAAADALATEDHARALAAAALQRSLAAAGAAGAVDRRVGRARPELPATPTATPAVVAGSGSTRRVWVPVQGAPALGLADAPVTIVAFLDPECPFSARLLPVLLAAREAHPAELRLVVRLRPLAYHRHAWGAATLLHLARAAGGDAGFFAALQYLYADDHQRALDRAGLDRHAAALGLDVLRLADALDARGPTELDRAIAADDAVGASVPIDATPTMLVNGVQVAGAVPRERVDAIVADELRHARAVLAGGARRASLYDTLARTAAPSSFNPASRSRPPP